MKECCHDCHQVFQDWADTHTYCQNACRPILGDFAVDGDSNGVPSIEDMVGGLVAEIARLKGELDLFRLSADNWRTLTLRPAEIKDYIDLSRSREGGK